MKVHFIGIGGIGVSALAQYYLAKGHQVSGSDLVSSEITDLLKRKGVKIYIGPHKKKCLTPDVKQAIYSPAVRKDNPELLEAKKRGIKVQSYPQALGELTKKYFTIAVSGTHGKSTTTAMIALILIRAGFDPTVILGTKLKEFGNSNFRMGGQPRFRVVPRLVPRSSAILVIESDEWNASFLNYWPKIIILTNIEMEHLDYYKSLNHILKTYKEFISHLPRNGVLVTNGKDKNILNIKNQISKLPRSRTSSLRGKQFKIQKFSSGQDETRKLREILRIPGEHNILNALAALTTARVLKIPDRISFKSLSKYRGAWRRFEIIEADLRGLTRKITIVSDYGHHPTEIKATLKAAREKFPHKKIWCIFQPHQYQRTFYLFKDFVKVFQQSYDKVFINKVIITDIYDVAGREQKNIKKKVNSKKLIKEINRPSVVYLPKEGIINYLKKNLKGREVVIIMGAGDIYKITDN